MKPSARDSASWVVVHRATGAAALETFNKRQAETFNREAFEVVPILEWLARVNKAAKEPSK